MKTNEAKEWAPEIAGMKAELLAQIRDFMESEYRRGYAEGQAARAASPVSAPWKEVAEFVRHMERPHVDSLKLDSIANWIEQEGIKRETPVSEETRVCDAPDHEQSPCVGQAPIPPGQSSKKEG